MRGPAVNCDAVISLSCPCSRFAGVRAGVCKQGGGSAFVGVVVAAVSVAVVVGLLLADPSSCKMADPSSCKMHT